MINRTLIHSNYNGVNIYRLKSKKYDFEIVQLQPNGNLITLKTSDNGMLTKILDDCGICTDRLQALVLINSKLES